MAEAHLVGVVSDTHLPRRGMMLPPRCRELLAACDLIVHAGDHSDIPSLAALRSLGPPVVAVHGNADDPAVRAALPLTAQLDLPGLRLAVVHDAGPAAGRLVRLRRRFPDAGAVIFGHSHIPLLERADDGFLILNPGSATDRRRQPHHTIALLRTRDGAAPEVEFADVDPA